MPIYIQPVTEQHSTTVAALRFIVDATETVDSYSTDYLTRADAGTWNVLVVDRDMLSRERVGDVLRVLAELDAIVSGAWEWALMEAVTPEARLRVDTVERARTLAAAIREGLGQAPIPTGDTGEIDEAADAPAPVAAIPTEGHARSVDYAEVIAGRYTTLAATSTHDAMVACARDGYALGLSVNS